MYSFIICKTRSLFWMTSQEVFHFWHPIINNCLVPITSPCNKPHFISHLIKSHFIKQDHLKWGSSNSPSISTKSSVHSSNINRKRWWKHQILETKGQCFKPVVRGPCLHLHSSFPSCETWGQVIWLHSLCLRFPSYKVGIIIVSPHGIVERFKKKNHKCS